MRLIVVGDSHANAVLGAINARQAAGDPSAKSMSAAMLSAFPEFLKPFHKLDLYVTFTDEDTREKFRSLSGSEFFRPDPQFVYCIVIPYTTNLLLWDTMWNTHLPWKLAHESGKCAISDAVFREIVAGQLKHIVAFLADLKATGVRFLVMETPPIRAEDRAIRNGSLRPAWILEIDRSARETIDAFLHQMDISVVKCPPETYQGAARESFLKGGMGASRPNDTHHANAIFGEHMLAAIEAELARTAAG